MPGDNLVDEEREFDHVKGHVDTDRFVPNEFQYLAVTVLP
jgi:hypothetical protein